MSNESRRKLLKSMVAGGGAIVAGRALPEKWSAPVVNSVVLPAHAQTSPVACPMSISYTSAIGGTSTPPGVPTTQPLSDGLTVTFSPDPGPATFFDGEIYVDGVLTWYGRLPIPAGGVWVGGVSWPALGSVAVRITHVSNPCAVRQIWYNVSAAPANGRAPTENSNKIGIYPL